MPPPKQKPANYYVYRMMLSYGGLLTIMVVFVLIVGGLNGRIDRRTDSPSSGTQTTAPPTDGADPTS